MELITLIKRLWAFIQTKNGKRLSIFLTILLVAFVSFGLAVPFIFSPQYLTATFTKSFQNATGKHVSIQGSIRARAFPWPGLDVSDVRLSNPAQEYHGNELLLVKLLKIDFYPSKLLTGTARAKSITLESPLIQFKIDRKGKENWDFRNKIPQHPGYAYNGALRNILLILKNFPYQALPETLIIHDGSVHYNNEMTGKVSKLLSLNKSIFFTPSQNKVQIKGSGILDDVPTDWFLDIDNARAFYTKERSKIQGALTTNTQSYDIKGTLERNNYNGNITIALSSLKDAIPSLNTHMLLQHVQTPLDFTLESSNFMWSPREFKIRDAKFKIDKLSGLISGGVSFNKDETPAINIDATIENGNLDSFFVRQPPNNATPSNAQKTSIPTMNDRAAMGVPQPSAAEITKTTPFDLTLPGVILNTHIDINAMSVLGMRMEKALATIYIKENKLRIDLTNAGYWDGILNLHLMLDTQSAGTPEWVYVAEIYGINIEHPLRYLTGRAHVGGLSNISFTLASKGNSLESIARQLSGNGSIFIKNGTLRGIELFNMFRNIPNSLHPDQLRKFSTDFDALFLNYNVNQGLANINNMFLMARFINAKGNGTFDVPTGNLNFTLTPQKVVKLNNANTAGGKFNYPIQFTGDIAEPFIRPDVKTPIPTNKPVDEKEIDAQKALSDSESLKIQPKKR